MITSNSNSEVDQTTVDQTTEEPEESYEVQMGRYRQALHIGYVEMERVVDEVIIPEFTRIGELLMEHNYEVEVIVFDTEYELDEKMFICGAGLRINKQNKKNAIVYTGDPHSFQFVLQTQNSDSHLTEEAVDYHKLTPIWFHKRVIAFMQSNCAEVDLSDIESSFSDDWEMYQGPFSVKIKNEYGYYNEISSEETIESAFRAGSIAIRGEFAKEDDLLVIDKNGREVS